MNLSKLPSSTLQIYGTEEAFFQAVKTNHNTPKFGLISHASLVVEATAQNKGKMARILAAKASLCARIDAHTTWKDDATAEEKAAFGMEARYELERKLAAMEGKPKGEAIAPPPSKMVKQEEPIIKNGSEPSESRDVDMTDDESDEDEEIEERFHGKKGDDSFSDDSEKEGKKHKSKKDKNKSGLEKMAKKAGLSIKRYQRKLEHGETKFDTEGDPTSIDKKEVERPREETKKAMKAEAKEAGKKRKRTDDGGKQVIGTEKKKKE
jgi:nucleolar protein 58